jgi:transcription elongation factor GreA
VDEREPMTPNGYSMLKERLRLLKEIEMPRISKDIGAAIAMGDLSENAEYHAAKDRQGMIAAQIRDMEDKLARAEVIDSAKLSGARVIFSATVTIEDLETADRSCYTIVGEDEADTKSSKISFKSPLARALIGREEGDEVVVNTPRGRKEYEIVQVCYNGAKAED